MMDWDGLRCFLAVAEAGSFTRAADRLRLSQPTVGRRMAELEALLRTRLFESSGRRLLLTAEGESLLQTARRMQAEADGAQRQLAGRDVAPAGTVRLSCTEGVGVRWLVPCLKRLADAYPALAPELVIDNQAVNLSRREADIAVRMRTADTAGRGELQQDLIGRRVGRLSVGLYAGRGYAERFGLPEGPDDLRRHRFVVIEGAIGDSGYGRPMLRPDAGPAGFATNSLLAQSAAVRAGFGLGVMATVLARDDPELVPVPITPAPRGPDVWLLFHADLRGLARIRVTVDHLVAAMQADPRLLAAD